MQRDEHVHAFVRDLFTHFWPEHPDVSEEPKPVMRRATYRMYPTARQRVQLEGYRDLHAEIYNACLEERESAWTHGRHSITFRDQKAQIKDIRELRPDVVPLGAQAIQSTIKRVDLAFAAFFRRVKAHAAEPGYPRYHRADRHKGWQYQQHRNCWRFYPDERKGAHGHLDLFGIGMIRVRGRARTPGILKTCTITERAGKWHASIVLACFPKRIPGTRERSFVFSTDHFLCFDDGETIDLPDNLIEAEAKLEAALMAVKQSKPGGLKRRRADGSVNRCHELARQRRKDFLHRLSTRLVRDSSSLSFSADLSAPMLEGAPGLFLQMLRYKAEEAGVELKEVK